MHFLGERGAGAQARIRADAAARADIGFLQMAERLDARACGDLHIAQHAVCADADACAERDLAFEHAIDIDAHIARASEAAAHVDARRVGQRGAVAHQLRGDLPLINALEFGQLRLAVHAQRFPGGAGLGRTNLHLIRHRGGNDVGEVILFLRILVLQSREPGLKARGRQHHDAGIDFTQRPFGRGCIIFLDDALDLAAAAHDAAITMRIVEFEREQRESLARGPVKRHQRLRPGERHVAVEHQSRHLGIEVGQRLRERMAGA